MIVASDARRIPLADEAVQCVVTSPPYWGLRKYGLPRAGRIAHTQRADGDDGVSRTGYNEQDAARLKVQADRLLSHLRAMAARNIWQTVTELCSALSHKYPRTIFPENSISAQCRNLRKSQLGGYDVRGRYRTKHLYEYRLFETQERGQMQLLDIGQQHYQEDVR